MSVSSSPIGVGLIGVGNWALRGHLPVLQLLPDYKIVAVQSRRREVAEQAARLFDINRSAFGDVGEDYVLEGAHGDNLPLTVLAVPRDYEWLPASILPSSVLELGNLFAALARDLQTGGHEAPTFTDGVRMHRLMDGIVLSRLPADRSR